MRSYKWASCICLVVFLVAVTPLTSNAAIYMNIRPLMTLGEIKAQLPHAAFERLYPAWVTNDKAFYKITGTGLSGTIYVAFFDHTQAVKDSMAAASQDGTDSSGSLVFSEDIMLTTFWARWVPDSPLPVSRLEAQYGPYDRTGYSSDGLEPYREWTSKGVMAYASDNMSYFNRVDFSFTDREVYREYKLKGWEIPEELRYLDKPKPDKRTGVKK